jgi:hypothetical protein
VHFGRDDILGISNNNHWFCKQNLQSKCTEGHFRGSFGEASMTIGGIRDGKDAPIEVHRSECADSIVPTQVYRSSTRSKPAVRATLSGEIAARLGRPPRGVFVGENRARPYARPGHISAASLIQPAAAPCRTKTTISEASPARLHCSSAFFTCGNTGFSEKFVRFWNPAKGSKYPPGNASAYLCWFLHDMATKAWR